MTALSDPRTKAGALTPALRPFHLSPKNSAQSKYRRRVVKSLSENAGGHFSEQQVMADLVVKALWKSFPECHSENEIADAASPYFRDKKGDPISPRTVRYWLRGETLPSALHLAALVKMQPGLFLGHWLGRDI